jgi:hypothetical protein
MTTDEAALREILAQELEKVDCARHAEHVRKADEHWAPFLVASLAAMREALRRSHGGVEDGVHKILARIVGEMDGCGCDDHAVRFGAADLAAAKASLSLSGSNWRGMESNAVSVAERKLIDAALDWGAAVDWQEEATEQRLAEATRNLRALIPPPPPKGDTE